MTHLQFLTSAITSGDYARAEAAAQGVAALGADAIPALLDLLASPDTDSRWWAVRTLAAISDPQIPSRLREALHDPDPAVRQCAALGLSQQPDSKSIPDLIAALNDDDRLTARLAADALGAIGADAVPALLEIMKNGLHPARLEAARTLAVIGDHRSIPTLLDALDGDSALIEYWAEQGLERIGVGMTFFKPE
ncbi:MAG: HEAT repeat domain-containing protein [Chloroflexi bacterium]|nr:HEAT repeat domain-containing protein [Chloroflexota bacterium]